MSIPYRDFVRNYRKQQKIDKAALFSSDKCLDAITDFIKKVGEMEPVAEKIVFEAIRNCESREGMESNGRIFKDYLEAVTPREAAELKQLGWSDSRIAELDEGEKASIIRNKMTPESAKEETSNNAD